MKLNVHGFVIYNDMKISCHLLIVLFSLLVKVSAGEKYLLHYRYQVTSYDASTDGPSFYLGTPTNPTSMKNYIFGYEVFANGDINKDRDFAVLVDGDKDYFIYQRQGENTNRVFGPFKPHDKVGKSFTCSYSSSISFSGTITVYDSIRLIVYPHALTQCIADSSQLLTFMLNVGNSIGVLKGFDITARDPATGKDIGYKYFQMSEVHNPNGSMLDVNVKFCDLKLYNDAYFSRNIQLVVHPHYSFNLLSSEEVESNIVNKIFLKQLPAVYSTEFLSTSCGKGCIRLRVNAEYERLYSGLQFCIKRSGTNVSNVTQLTEVKYTSDYLYLICNSCNDNITTPTTYDLQISDTTNHRCAVSSSFEMIPPKAILRLSGSLGTYSFVDKDSNKQYEFNISRYGANDGTAYLTVSDEQRIGQWQYSTDGGNSWKDLYTGISRNAPKNYSYNQMQPHILYAFRIMDTDGCPSQVVSFDSLKEPRKLEMITHVSPSSCSLNDKVDDTTRWKNGYLKVEWQGGCGPYKVYLYNEKGRLLKTFDSVCRFYQEIDNLSPGKYKVLLIAHTTADSLSQFIEIPAGDDILLNCKPTGNRCYGNSDGEIKVMAYDNATFIKRYVLKKDGDSIASITTGSDTVVFPSLPPGKYAVKVINPYGCYDITPDIIINQPDKILMTAVPEKIARYGDATGRIKVTVKGGTLPYSITCKDSMEVVIDSQSLALPCIAYDNLRAGKYKIVLTDDHSCRDSLSGIEVQQPLSALKLSYIQKNVSCFGDSSGSLRLVASGGWPPYRYGWNGLIRGTGSVIDRLPASVYTDSVFVMDSMNVCEKLPVRITQPDLPLLVGIKNITEPLCYGDRNGKIILKFHGGTPPYEISTDSLRWFSGDSLTGMGAVERYKIYIRDANDCHTSLLATITAPLPVEAMEIAVNGAHCHQYDGSILNAVRGGTVSGDYRYEWYSLDSLRPIYNPARELQNIRSGRYMFVASDDHECSDTLVQYVSDSDGPVIEEITLDSVTCHGFRDGGVHIRKTSGGRPGYSYFIDNRRFTGDTAGLEAGKYQLRIEDSQRCRSYKDFMLTEPAAISIHSVMKNPTCTDYRDGMISVYPSGGNGSYRFHWNGGDTVSVLEGLASGLYSVTVFDRKRCFAGKKFELFAPDPVAPLWKEHETVVCEGNVKTLDAGSFNSYCWYKGSDTLARGRKVAIYQPGTYYVRVTDEKGCVGVDSFRLRVSTHPLEAVLFVADSAAAGEPVTAVDVTWPVPDSIQWLFDAQVDRLSANEWSQDFTLHHEGTVKVTLRAWYGGCYSDSSQAVKFYGSWDEKEKSMREKKPLIVHYSVFPNPNTGKFTVYVELSREADVSLAMYHAGMPVTSESRMLYGAKEYREEYNISGLPPGIYLLVLRAAEEQKMQKIIIE